MQLSRESAERKGQGLMIGCLVCWERLNNEFSGRRVILYALSGNSKGFSAAAGVRMPMLSWRVSPRCLPKALISSMWGPIAHAQAERR